MASIKELRQKISSLKNTSKITSAMKMVASSKLRRSQEAMIHNKPYHNQLQKVITSLIPTAVELEHPLLNKRPLKKVQIFVISSDKGLCGSFNNGLFRFASKEFASKFDSDTIIEVKTLGKKSNDYFSKKSRGYDSAYYPDLVSKPDYNSILPIIEESIRQFERGEIDGLFMIYNQFKSMISQVPTMEQLLPIESKTDEEKQSDFLFEPSSKDLINRIFPLWIKTQFFRSILENSAGEHVSRMNAMENATNNTIELIKKYTLVMNRARQSAITTELTEIVAGAESLKG